MPGACIGQKRVSDSWEPELQMVVSPHVRAGSGVQVLFKSKCFELLNHLSDPMTDSFKLPRVTSLDLKKNQASPKPVQAGYNITLSQKSDSIFKKLSENINHMFNLKWN